MSVYTLLNQNQIEALLAQYEIPSSGSGLQSYSEIADGIENSNYLVRAANKEYVLTIFERVAVTDFSPYLSFMAAAQAQGKSVPCPLLNLNGERLSSFKFEGNRKGFILCERLAGSHPQTISVALCEHLGEQIASLHSLNLSKDLLNQFPFQALDTFILSLDFETILSEEKQALFKSTRALVSTLDNRAKALNLTKGIVHCDFFPDNSLTMITDGKESITAFLDWYDARYTYLLIDLAIIAVSWCTEKFQLVKEKEAALLRGYQKILPFNENDSLLWNAFLRAAALFFWISREDYHTQMHLQKRAGAINPKKSTEEFYRLLLNLKK